MEDTKLKRKYDILEAGNLAIMFPGGGLDLTGKKIFTAWPLGIQGLWNPCVNCLSLSIAEVFLWLVFLFHVVIRYLLGILTGVMEVLWFRCTLQWARGWCLRAELRQADILRREQVSKNLSFSMVLKSNTLSGEAVW